MLLARIRSCDSLQSFKTQLKVHFFWWTVLLFPFISNADALELDSMLRWLRHLCFIIRQIAYKLAHTTCVHLKKTCEKPVHITRDHGPWSQTCSIQSVIKGSSVYCTCALTRDQCRKKRCVILFANTALLTGTGLFITLWPISVDRVQFNWSMRKFIQFTTAHAADNGLSLIHIWRCRRSTLCRSRWSPYH